MFANDAQRKAAMASLEEKKRQELERLRQIEEEKRAIERKEHEDKMLTRGPKNISVWCRKYPRRNKHM